MKKAGGSEICKTWRLKRVSQGMFRGMVSFGFGVKSSCGSVSANRWVHVSHVFSHQRASFTT